MTRLFNDPARFSDEAMDGFAAAYPRWVRRVSGGVVRNRPPRPGEVALIVGGGAGHYPAFAGLVGDGLAAAAVVGNVFASPSTARVVSVATAAAGDGGVLLSYGNYAGDVLNFTAAQEQLRSAGIPCHAVAVTDDVSSAPSAEAQRRRGVAGDLVVFKVAGAAAASGAPLAEVARIASHANDRTRTLGVAFSGPTLPGADTPLFTVAPDRMAVGLGIHGEPGLSESAIPSADGLAQSLVSRLLEELPTGMTSARGRRVVAVLNGLGSVKYEELFVVYRAVRGALLSAGVTIADCEVGEVCTSFDMAGVSLTLLWLDTDLERLWTAPADAPAFRRALVPATGGPPAADRLHERADGLPLPQPDVTTEIPAASNASRRAAVHAAAAFAALEHTITANVEELGRIDAAAGDGDHGIGMQYGARAASATAATSADAGAGIGTVIARAGDAWADQAGGTSGALWGLGLRALGESLGDSTPPRAQNMAEAVSAAYHAVSRAGGAAVGDKTMIDALAPFAATLTDQADGGARLTMAWRSAAEAAQRAAEDTRNLLPRMGRARPHAERSLGTPDAGAVSLAMVVTAIADLLDATVGTSDAHIDRQVTGAANLEGHRS